MPSITGPFGVVGWLAATGDEGKLAGAAFLIGSDLAITCAHGIRDHLGLPSPTPKECPSAKIVVRFAALGSEVPGRVLAKGWFPDSARSTEGLSDIAVIRLD